MQLNEVLPVLTWWRQVQGSRFNLGGQSCRPKTQAAKRAHQPSPKRNKTGGYHCDPPMNLTASPTTTQSLSLGYKPSFPRIAVPKVKLLNIGCSWQERQNAQPPPLTWPSTTTSKHNLN